MGNGGGGASPLAIDDTTVYWLQGSGLLSCDKNVGCGTNPTPVLSSLGTPSGFALDATHVYVLSSSDVRSCTKTGCTTPTILYGIDGGNPPTIPTGIATDGVHLWFGDRGVEAVFQMTTSGAMLTWLGWAHYPTAVTYSGSSIFWSDIRPSASGIVRAQAGGADSGADYLLQLSPSGLTTDGVHLFWANAEDSTSGLYDVVECGVTSCPAPGPTKLAEQQPQVAGFGGPANVVATDGTNVYWMSGDGSSSTAFVRRCAIAGCGLRPADVTSYTGVANHTIFGGIAVDQQFVYFLIWDNGITKILKAAK
jgi:hypothetical protein